jgi:hypothetical protein
MMNRRGSGLIYVMMGITMMSGLTYFVTSTMMRINQSDVAVRAKMDQLSMHMQGVTMVRNTAIRDKIIQQQAPAVYACLLGVGNGCSNLSGKKLEIGNIVLTAPSGVQGQADHSVTLKLKDELANAGCSGPECKTSRMAIMSPSCSSNIRCESMKFIITTKTSSGESTLSKTQRTELSYSYSPTRVGFNQIDYSCAFNGGYISGVSFRNMVAQCQGINGVSQCQADMPLLGFGNNGFESCLGNIPRGNACARGVASVAISRGISTCN